MNALRWTTSRDTESEWLHAQVFRREGEYWTVVFAGAVCRMRDSTGLHYIADLLRQPNCMIPAIEIVRLRGSYLSPEERASDDAAARERARINVTRAIGAALKRIAEHHPLLGTHLRGTIRTGNICSYSPDPRLPLRWEM